jgi:hypothetical protein
MARGARWAPWPEALGVCGALMSVGGLRWPPTLLCSLCFVWSQAAYFSPSGSKHVVSTSFDDTVRVSDASRGMETVRSFAHDNATGRQALERGCPCTPLPLPHTPSGVLAQRVVPSLPSTPTLSTPTLRCVRMCVRARRWVLPFRAVWTPAGDGVLVGNMKRGIDVFSVATGARVKQLTSPHMTAIPSRLCAAAGSPLVAGATNSGRIHLFRK